MAKRPGIDIPITGDVKGLQKALGDADSSLSGFAGKAGKALGGVALAMGAMAGAAGVALFKIGQSFDDSYDKIRIGTGATGDALDGLKDSFKAVLTTVPTDADSASTAIADLNTRLGLTGAPLEALAGQFLNLSRITGTDVGSNIETVTRLFGDWGVAVEDQSAAMDGLFRASQATGAGIDQLAGQAVQFGAPLRQMGFGFEETVALLGKFEKEGVNTELVMGSMRIALGKFAREGEAAPDAMRRLVDEISGMEDPTQATARAMEIFGARAGPDMAAAIREGRFELGDLFDTVAHGTETINGAADDTADFGEKWQLLKNKVLVALEPLATRVFDAIGRAMDRILPVVDRVLGAFDEGGLSGVFAMLGKELRRAWPKIRKTLGEMAEAFWQWVKDATPPMLRALGDLLRQLGQWVANVGFPALVAQLRVWADAFFAWAIVAVPPMLRELGRLLGALGQWILDEGLPLLVEKLLEWGEAFLRWVAPMIPPLLLELGKLLVDLGSWILTDALPFIAGKLLEWAGAFANWVTTTAIPALMRKMGELLVALTVWVVSTGLPALLRMGVALAQSAIRGLWGLLQQVPSLFSDMLGRIWDWIVRNARALANVGKEIGRKIADGISSSLGNLFGALGRNTVGRLPDWVIGGDGPRADGGPVRAGGSYLVGERGPELFSPGMSGAIIPNHALGSATGSTTYITVNMPPGSDGDDVLRALQRLKRRQGPGPLRELVGA